MAGTSCVICIFNVHTFKKCSDLGFLFGEFLTWWKILKLHLCQLSLIEMRLPIMIPPSTWKGTWPSRWILAAKSLDYNKPQPPSEQKLMLLMTRKMKGVVRAIPHQPRVER
jgi:hypothetical protein